MRKIQPSGEILSGIVFTKLIFILRGHLDVHLILEAIALQDQNGLKNSRPKMQMNGLQFHSRMNQDLEFIQINIKQEYRDALEIQNP
ncbi:hypothetical protein JTB14_032211 [Gonioctena quinquepunctata]|nr:hypothetical protein JTB14_032211 [Gonioctena quinquepunctata]